MRSAVEWALQLWLKRDTKNTLGMCGRKMIFMAHGGNLDGSISQVINSSGVHGWSPVTYAYHQIVSEIRVQSHFGRIVWCRAALGACTIF